MSLLHPPNIWGYASGDLYGKTAHFVSSSGTDSWTNSTTASTPCSLATAIAEPPAGGDLILVMDDGLYTPGADVVLPAGSQTDRIVWAGTNDQNGSADVNGGMPVLDFETGAYEFQTGNHNWIENIKAYRNTGAGNSLFAPDNSASTFHYKCLADNGINGFGDGNGVKALFCRARNCDTGFVSGTGGMLTYCFSDGNDVGYDVGVHCGVVFCIASDYTNEGIRTKSNGIIVVHCTCDGGTDGLETEANDMIVALFSHFTGNSGYGTLDHASNDGNVILIGCNFANNTTGNHSGATDISVGEMTTDPSYADGANDDYTPSAAAVINQEFGSVHDDAAPTQGEGLNGRSSFIDIGAIQLEDEAGGGGGVGVIIGG